MHPDAHTQTLPEMSPVCTKTLFYPLLPISVLTLFIRLPPPVYVCGTLCG